MKKLLILALLLLMAVPAMGTSTLVQKLVTYTAADSQSLTSVFGSDNTAGNVILATINYCADNGCGLGDTSALVVSDSKGDSYTCAEWRHYGHLFACYAYNILAGPNTVTFSTVASGGHMWYGTRSVSEWSGFARTLDPADLGYGAQAGSVISGLNTTTLTMTSDHFAAQADELVVAVFMGTAVETYPNSVISPALALDSTVNYTIAYKTATTNGAPATISVGCADNNTPLYDGILVSLKVLVDPSGVRHRSSVY
jgi:hypothetical protein